MDIDCICNHQFGSCMVSFGEECLFLCVEKALVYMRKNMQKYRKGLREKL